MKELKVRFIDDTYVEYYNTGKHDLAQVYLKSEADETIAELKDENRKLKRALWLERAEKAKHIATFCYYALHYGRVPVREIYQCQDKWDKVE